MRQLKGSGFDLRRAEQLLRANEGAYFTDLNTLVGIDSGTFDKAGVDRVVDMLAAKYSDLGARLQRKPNELYGDLLVVTFEGDGPGSVLLVGHTDTVYPPGTASGRPLQRQGHRVLGPGTADMKAGDLSILYALRALIDQGRERLGRVVVVHNSDEEIGSPASRETIRECATAADAVLVLEAGRENGDLVVARKGVIDVEVWVTGVAAHAGVNHDRGRSAVLALAHLVTALESLNGTFPDVTVNVGQIEGGERSNVVPDRAYARLEVRAFDRHVLEVAVERVEQIVSATAVEGTRARARVRVEHWPMPRSTSSERLFHLAQLLGAELGQTLDGAATGGASDANTAAEAGRPVLDGLGPIGGAAHSPGEYIDARSVVPRAALLAGLIAELSDSALGDRHRA